MVSAAVALLLSQSAAPAAPATPSPSPTPSATPGATIELRSPSEPTANERLQQVLRQDADRLRVQEGLADTYFLDLGRAVTRAWTPEAALAKGGSSSYLGQLGQSVSEQAQVYRTQAERYGRTGSPIAADSVPKDRPQAYAVPEGSLGTDITKQMEMQRILASESSAMARRTATVRIVQDARGRISSVTLVQSSGVATLDAQALLDLRAAAGRMPVPTEGALRGRSSVASLWELSIVASTSPPVPVVAVEFDEALGIADARVPLDRRVYKTVRLVGVE